MHLCAEGHPGERKLKAEGRALALKPGVHASYSVHASQLTPVSLVN